MNTNDIDELEEIIISGNGQALIEFLSEFKIEISFDMIEQGLKPTDIEPLAKQIENDNVLLDYLKQKSGELIEVIAINFKNNEHIKEIIKKHQEYELSGEGIRNLALATQDTEYIKEVIKKHQEYKLLGEEVKDLALATQDAQFIKKVIENYNQYGVNSRNIKDLALATQDAQFIKKVIENHNQYGVSRYIKDLALATQDSEVIKSIIQQSKTYGIWQPGDIKDLTIATRDIDYIKEIIEKGEYYILDDYIIKDLIIATQDIDYIKEIIKNFDKYGLSGESVKDLVIATEDTEYIKSIIENHERYGIYNYEIEKLAIATQDIDYIKDIVKKGKDYMLCDFAIKNLVIETKDTDYIKETIKNFEKYGLSGECIKDLIKATQDIDYIKEIIKGKNQYGISSSEIIDLVKFLYSKGDIEDVYKYLNEEKEPKPKIKINLPENMTVGIEIESENGIKNLRNLINKKWKIKGDASLQNGTEIVSPVLSGKTHSVEEIYDTCAVLQGTLHDVSERCGGHVHIGADYLTSVEAYENLMEIWTSSEKILYTISNKAGEIPREGTTKYSQPISKKIEEELENGEINLEEIDDLQRFVFRISEIQGPGRSGRYSGINFKNTLSQGKNTIEFRLSNGTIDPDTWIENINLYGGIVKSAQDLSIIQKKSIGELTTEDISKLKFLEILRNETSSQEEKFESLLGLAIKPEERKEYIERYKVNSELLKEETQLEESIDRQISIKKLDIKRIGKNVFIGKDAIKGEEYMQVASQIDRLAQREENSKAKN